MPRQARKAPGGVVFHVLNRAVARHAIFQKDGDYEAFERVFAEVLEKHPIQVLNYCLMPNHWHLVLWPETDGELTDFVRWLTHTHKMRWHAHHHSSGTGHLYQGRFKSFPIQADDHLYTVLRYVERNALRANLVAQAGRGMEMVEPASASHGRRAGGEFASRLAGADAHELAELGKGTTDERRIERAASIGAAWHPI